MGTPGEFPPRLVVCVGTVVLREDRVLFVRQTYGETLTGTWTLPWGFVQGVDDSGAPDPPDVAARREAREEGGVDAEITGFLGMQQHANRAGEPRLYMLFLARHVGGDPQPDNHETDRAQYFSLAELDALHDPIDPFCLWLARRVLRGEHHVIPPAANNPYAPHMAYL